MDSYHVLELAGEGSFGRVYKGRRRFTGQVVALKFMPKLGRSEKELRSLKREIEIMRGLEHPNIVQLFDSFETEAEVVVVTEYAEGQLFQILEDDGNLPESQVQEIACQLVSALYYLHSHRILHRDMKPQNILLGKSGVVKLCDFGFARSMSVSTLVLTSIKGTPLYMSPELVEEKPYDHTADLWSLGCILYELHTGTPPFYTNSIFHLVQLIVRNQVKWPDTMSDTCMNFLKGLLTKDPQRRLSWPDLLHHPFVADGVLVLPDSTGVFSPLTVAPSPDMLAMKRQQVAEKTSANSGGSRLLRKALEMENRGREEAMKIKEGGVGNGRAKSAPTGHVCVTPDPSVTTTDTTQSELKPIGSKHRGQISRDYEQEFPSVEVGPGVERRCSEDVDSEDYWEKLAQESDPCIHHREPLNHSAITPQLKSKILEFKAQLADGTVKEPWRIYQPLKVLRNLIETSDLEESRHMGQELRLPRVLFDLVHDAVENSHFIKQPWSLPVLGEMIVVLVMYWKKHCDWVEEEHRLEKFTEPFVKILTRPKLTPLAPLAANVLSLLAQHNANVEVDMDVLTSLLKNLLLDSYEPRHPLLSLTSRCGLCDGLLSLLHYTLSKHINGFGTSSLDPVMFLDLWKRIGSSVAMATPDTEFCSANGLHSFLSTALCVFTKDPYLCIPVFSDSDSKAVCALGRLLGTDYLHLFAEGGPGSLEVDVTHDELSDLSCCLLCFPFALDLESHTVATIFQVYHSCGIVASLLQVIQTLPPQLLELPLSLLSRLIMCDPEHAVPRLEIAASFLRGLENIQNVASKKQQAPPIDIRTAGTLLSDCLQQDALWEAAVALLTLLSQIARVSPRPERPQIHLEASVIQQALAHSHEPIKAATCRLLGNLDPFGPHKSHSLKPDIFKSVIDCLNDACVGVRRTACWAVGNWLGYIVARPGSKALSNGKRSDTTAWGKMKRKSLFKSDPDQERDNRELKRWTEEARRTVSILASIITDHDAVTRRHCCAALGNLVHVEGAVALLLEEDVSTALLRAACDDSHNAVRQAAVATLSLYSERGALRQVLKSLDAGKKLLQASQHVPPQCGYHQLIKNL